MQSINKHTESIVQLSNQFEKTSHLLGMSYMNLRMLNLGIKPVWIFDGPPSILKKNESIRRREQKELNQKMKESSIQSKDLEMALKFSKRSIFLTKEEIESAKTLLKLSGVDFYQSCEEADPLLVYLQKNKIIDKVLSSDSDLLVYGVNGLIKRADGKDKEMIMEQVDLQQILENLKLTFDQFVDFCILLGTDYNESAFKLGPVTAYKIIQEVQKFENIYGSKYESKFDLSSYSEYLQIKNLFTAIQNDQFQPKIWSTHNKSLEEIAENKENNILFYKGEKQLDDLREFYIEKDFSNRNIERFIDELSNL